MASSHSNNCGPSPLKQNPKSRSTSETPPECDCGLKCVLRTVKKETGNKGRKFWGCRDFLSKEDHSGCAFMKWTADPWPPQTQGQSIETQRAETGCAHCVELRNTIKEMKKDGESTKNLLKIALYSILLLVVACVMLVLKSGNSV